MIFLLGDRVEFLDHLPQSMVLFCCVQHSCYSIKITLFQGDSIAMQG